MERQLSTTRRTSLQHRLPYLVNCSTLFTELPMLERPGAAKGAGFDAIELWWPFAEAVPPDADIDRLVAAISDAGVSLVALNLAAGDMAGGDRGLLSWPGRQAELRDSIAVAVGIGERLGVRAFNALYGNRLPGRSPEEQDEVGLENLVVAAEAAGRIGASVLLEPLSGAPRYPLLTADDVVAVIDKAEGRGGAGTVGFLADLYHLSVNGDDLDAVAKRHCHRVAHVQIADAPGRHEPGTGKLEIDRHLEALEAAGYGGFVGLEYLASTTSDAAFDWLPRDRRSVPARAGRLGE